MLTMHSVSAMLYNILMSTKSFIFIPDDNRLQLMSGMLIRYLGVFKA